MSGTQNIYYVRDVHSEISLKLYKFNKLHINKEGYMFKGVIVLIIKPIKMNYQFRPNEGTKLGDSARIMPGNNRPVQLDQTNVAGLFSFEFNPQSSALFGTQLIHIG